MAELTSDPQLRLVDLDKTYPGGHHALRGVSLDVADGEVVVIIGPSGCGKSTLLRTINGLEPINSGQILFDGEDLAAPGVSWPEVRRRIGMVFQSYELFPHLTVMGNLTLAPGLVAGESRADAEERAHKLLERVGLADRADDYPRQLSGLKVYATAGQLHLSLPASDDVQIYAVSGALVRSLASPPLTHVLARTTSHGPASFANSIVRNTRPFAAA